MSVLMSRSVDLGDTGRDNQFGNGRINLGPVFSLNGLQSLYYNSFPELNLNFQDNNGLDDGWYRVDDSDWAILFTNSNDTVWQTSKWQLPDFASLPEGSHTLYFKASNDIGVTTGGDGEWHWQFYKDTIAPSPPDNLHAINQVVDKWSKNANIEVAWLDSSDEGSGLDGYSILLDDNSDSLPDEIKDVEENIQSFKRESLPDGRYYFHIRAVDNTGNWENQATHLGPFLIDTTAPASPLNLVSSDHVSGSVSDDNTIEVSWETSTDNLSELAGYAVLWDREPSTIPDNVNAGVDVLSIISDPLEDGDDHYFHIRAIDNANNWSSAVHLGPFCIAVDAPVLADGSVTPSRGDLNEMFKFMVLYTDLKENSPSQIEVVLDGVLSFPLAPSPGQDGSFANGEIYEGTVAGKSIGTGNHGFAFLAIDNTDHRAIGDIGIHTGLVIESIQPPPFPPSSPPGPISGGGGGGGGSSNRIYLNEYMNPPGTFERDISLRAYDGICTLMIPQGTVGKTKEGWALSYIILKPLQPEDEKPPSPQVGGLASRIYRLEPDGVTFSPAVTIYLLYKENEIPSGFGESDLRIGYWDKGQGKWVVLEGCKVDAEKNAVAAPLSHFSYYALLAVPPAPLEPTLSRTGDTVVSPVEKEEKKPEESLPAVTPKVSDTVNQSPPTSATAGAFESVVQERKRGILETALIPFLTGFLAVMCILGIILILLRIRKIF